MRPCWAHNEKSHPKVAFFSQRSLITWKQQPWQRQQLRQQPFWQHQQRQKQREQLLKQQEQQLVQEQQLEPVLVQEQLLLFCHKQTKQQQRQSQRSRREIYSFEIPSKKNNFRKLNCGHPQRPSKQMFNMFT
jgi:hypothetical protein